jgi:alpha-1,3/alpha-1,6-mannosyltransferase
MRVLIVHPDLGVGGAERLILDIAAAAKSNGNQVTILTNQYDPRHCFADSKDFDIITKFSWMPRHLFGRFHALFAYVKLLLASLWFIYFGGIQVNAVIIDQVSLPNLVFKCHKYKVLFYCHYPDQLLCIRRTSVFMQLYRKPLDALESWTTGYLNRHKI